MFRPGAPATRTPPPDCTCDTYTRNGAGALEDRLKNDLRRDDPGNELDDREKFGRAIKLVQDCTNQFPNCLKPGKSEDKARPSFMLRQRLWADRMMSEDRILSEELKQGLVLRPRSWGLDTKSAPLIASRLLRIGGAPLIASQLRRTSDGKLATLLAAAVEIGAKLKNYCEDEIATVLSARMWTTFVKHDVNELIGIFDACKKEPVADASPASATFLALPPSASERQAKGDRDSWSVVAEKIVNGLTTTETSKVEDTVGESETTAADTTSSVTSEKVWSSSAPLRLFATEGMDEKAGAADQQGLVEED